MYFSPTRDSPTAIVWRQVEPVEKYYESNRGRLNGNVLNIPCNEEVYLGGECLKGHST